VELGLKGKVALVAAASRGIGRAVAEELAAEGASLVLCARGAEALEAARAEIAARAGVPVVALPADVSREEDVSRVVGAGLEAFGRIDVLVTNTGGPPAGPFEQHTLAAWREAERLLLESAVHLIRGVLPGMKERRSGRIIALTSIVVKQPAEGLILSTSLRAAVAGLARSLANELGPYGITVNHVLPGYTRTERVTELAHRLAAQRGTTPESVLAGWEAEIPLRRLAEPREVAALVAFLASERAGYITGASIPVDGGWIRSLF